MDPFKKELSEKPYINKTYIYFRRPTVYIEITLNEKYTNDNAKEIMDIIKKYIHPNLIKTIGKKYWSKFNGMPWRINISISSSTDDSIKYGLSARYYKTHHASDINPDTGEDNIENYEIWYGEEDFLKGIN